MANEQVLVIDDASQNTDFLAEYVLTPNGYDVLIAADGETGLKMALEQHPDLILLDMNLGRMTGIEVLQTLSDQEVNIPVIMMTFHGSETLVVKAFRMGVKDYILKPFDIAEMLEAIERALTEARLRNERDELTRRLLNSNKELEQRLRELNTLFGIGKSVTSLLDQDKLLSRLVEAALFLTRGEEGSLLLVDEQTDELYMVAARGIDERVVRSFRLKVNDSLAGQVITSGQPIILTSQDFTKINTSYLVRSLMYVPIKVRERVSGVLAVDNRYQDWDFTNHHLRLLSALADYAAITLENAQLFSQIESEHTKLATILSEIEEPVVVVSGDENRIVIANFAFRQIFGMADAASVEARPLDEVLFNPSLLKFVAAAPDGSHKGEILLSDGRTFYATLTPVPNVGRAVVMKDVTHFKELDRMKTDFVSTVSHDLRAPLTSIKEYSQMLPAIGDLNEKQALFVGRITHGIDQITSLIDNLLDLSTIELGVDPDINKVNLDVLVTQVISEFQEQARRKQQILSYHTTGQAILVQGNLLRLKQVVGNLVDNALKYSATNAQISTYLRQKEDKAIFTIEDNGRGIPHADLPFVFDKFFRVKVKDQAETKGTGLGLAICKSIIEKYRGHIWVESQAGSGSTFSFNLPTLAEESDSPQTAVTEKVFLTR